MIEVGKKIEVEESGGRGKRKEGFSLGCYCFHALNSIAAAAAVLAAAVGNTFKLEIELKADTSSDS